MREVEFVDEVRAAMFEAGKAKGFPTEVVAGCLAAVARDIGRDFETLRLRPPDHPERRTYQKRVEALGLVEAVCEERGHAVVVIRLRIEAFV